MRSGGRERGSYGGAVVVQLRRSGVMAAVGRVIPLTHGPKNNAVCVVGFANKIALWVNEMNTLIAVMNPNKALWEKGDFTRLAATMRESGEALVQRGLTVTNLLRVATLIPSGRARTHHASRSTPIRIHRARLRRSHDSRSRQFGSNMRRVLF